MTSSLMCLFHYLCLIHHINPHQNKKKMNKRKSRIIKNNFESVKDEIFKKRDEYIMNGFLWSGKKKQVLINYDYFHESGENSEVNVNKILSSNQKKNDLHLHELNDNKPQECDEIHKSITNKLNLQGKNTAEPTNVKNKNMEREAKSSKNNELNDLNKIYFTKTKKIFEENNKEEMSANKVNNIMKYSKTVLNDTRDKVESKKSEACPSFNNKDFSFENRSQNQKIFRNQNNDKKRNIEAIHESNQKNPNESLQNSSINFLDISSDFESEDDFLLENANAQENNLVQLNQNVSNELTDKVLEISNEIRNIILDDEYSDSNKKIIVKQLRNKREALWNQIKQNDPMIKHENNIKEYNESFNKDMFIKEMFDNNYDIDIIKKIFEAKEMILPYLQNGSYKQSNDKKIIKIIYNLMKFKLNTYIIDNLNSIIAEMLFIIPGIHSKNITIIIADDMQTAKYEIQIMKNCNISYESILDQNFDLSNSGSFLLKFIKQEIKFLFLTLDTIDNQKVLPLLNVAYARNLVSQVVVLVKRFQNNDKKLVDVIGTFYQNYSKNQEIPFLIISSIYISPLKNKLKISDSNCFIMSISRDNIIFDVYTKKEPNNSMNDMLNWIRKNDLSDQCGIIICLTHNDAEAINYFMKKRGIKSAFIHSKLSEIQENDIVKSWIEEKVNMLISDHSISFSSKSNVRYIIFSTIPMNINLFLANCNQIGLDGLVSYCLISYNSVDVIKVKKVTFAKINNNLDKSSNNVSEKELNSMISICENNNECRRVLLYKSYGIHFDPKECHLMCDNCIKAIPKEGKDYSIHGLNLIRIVKELLEKGTLPTKNYIVSIYLGKNTSEIKRSSNDKLKLFGYGKQDFSQGKENRLKQIIQILIYRGFFHESYKLTKYGKIVYLLPTNNCESITTMEPIYIHDI